MGKRLETTVDTSTPTFTYGSSSGVTDDPVGDRGGSVALVFDSRVRALDENLDVTVYTVPELEEPVELMGHIEV